MISHKHITKVISVIMAAAVIFCIFAAGFSQEAVEVLGSTGVAMQYEAELFNTEELIQIDIQMDEEEWEDMLDHAIAEEYYPCDVVVNGRKIYNVGIRPKGNTSLSSIAEDPETDRFSLKLEFDHYVEGQTCFGLDKLILNNNYADATNMKEALVYDMYQYLEADASLYHYAEISVNGEYWGVYLALEAVEDSFLLRNYGTQNGALYKPDGMNMEDKGDDFAGENQPPDREGGFGAPDMEGGFGAPDREGGFGAPDMGERPALPEGGDFSAPPGGDFTMGNAGADLNYTDDDLDSYSAIWEGEVADTGKADHQRVVTALQKISAGTDLEKYLDVDNVLKYMAVHTFAVNMDSLSGTMAHNYYLYENDGMLNILPWDYNLSFGGMGGMGGRGSNNDASEVVNAAIDSPFQGTDFFDALLEDEEYLSRYHEYLEALTEEYVLGGRFDAAYQRIRNQIDGLVKTDPTALYSYEEYDAGARMLYLTVMLRAESIRGQLSGAIPSTEEGQKADAENRVDASMIDIETMGVMTR